MKHLIYTILFMVSVAQASGQGVDTFEVYFANSETKLSKESCDFIDQLIFKDKLIHGQKLILLGYANYTGESSINNKLSDQRAKSVQDYLVKMGFKPEDVRLCAGRGAIARQPSLAEDGYATDRKVEIIIVREKKVIAAPIKPPPAIKANELSKVKVNETIALNNLFFKPGMADMLPTSFPELEKMAAFLKEHKTVTIRIEGHVCCLGPIEGQDNDGLSEYRALAVFDYLVAKGISSERLKYIGLGNSNPVVKEELTEEDRIKNRRVEIRILSK